MMNICIYAAVLVLLLAGCLVVAVAVALDLEDFAE